jgi:hypothetical protein
MYFCCVLFSRAFHAKIIVFRVFDRVEICRNFGGKYHLSYLEYGGSTFLRNDDKI